MKTKNAKLFAFLGLLALVAVAVPVALWAGEGGGCSAWRNTAASGCGAGSCPAPAALAGPAGQKGAVDKPACGPDCTKPCCADKTSQTGPDAHARLAAVLKALDGAEAAIKAGDHKAALAHLAAARQHLAEHHGPGAGPKPVNANCPMTGRPAREGFTRVHGETAVGFCGPGCAVGWDRATAEQRARLLENARAAAAGAEAQTPKSESSSFANTTCPIMGTKIDPTNVPAHLVRDYRGQRVAFCCGGCPAAWDRLSDAEKEVKLAKPAGRR